MLTQKDGKWKMNCKWDSKLSQGSRLFNRVYLDVLWQIVFSIIISLLARFIFWEIDCEFIFLSGQFNFETRKTYFSMIVKHFYGFHYKLCFMFQLEIRSLQPRSKVCFECEVNEISLAKCHHLNAISKIA